jgi:hypothetical protein
MSWQVCEYQAQKKIEEYKQMVQNWHRFLTDIWCTMEGLKVTLEQSNDAQIQERFYNGWTHDHYVTLVICFCPDGMIPIIYINIPGSVHDSQVANYGNIYDKLESVYERLVPNVPLTLLLVTLAVNF